MARFSQAKQKGVVGMLALLLLVNGCRGTNTMSDTNVPNPGGNQEENAPDIPELDRYLFSGDEYSAGIVPRRLVPVQVARYLIGKIKKEHDEKVFARVELVADFYDTFEVAPTFKAFLDQSESDEKSFIKSAEIVRIIARCGGEGNIGFAAQYYKHLIRKATTVRTFEELVRIHEALGLGLDSADLRKKMKEKSDSLTARKAVDYQAEIELKNFSWPIEQKLMRVERAETTKRSILSIAGAQKRIIEETKAYLGMEYGSAEVMVPWAARRLRRETWATNPSDQIERNDAEPLKKDVAAILRQFIENPELAPDGKPAGNESLKLRLLRAIKFFEGEVTEKESRFLEENKNQQGDLLANEGFMLTNS